jgi:hypothetical protein
MGRKGYSERQYAAGHYPKIYADQYGGNDFTEAECKQWLADNFTNPKTGRKIGPTKSGSGVYYDLQKACLGTYKPSSFVEEEDDIQKAETKHLERLLESARRRGDAIAQLQLQQILSSNSEDNQAQKTEIIRNDVGRKSPAISATSLPVGTKRTGGDGRLYIVKLRANSTQYWQPCAQSTANC